MPIGALGNIHGSRLKFHHDPSHKTDAIISYVISSDLSMFLQRLLGLVETEK